MDETHNLHQAEGVKHFCKNCGKEVKEGTHFTKENEKYCCETCCSLGPREELLKSANVCQFC